MEIERETYKRENKKWKMQERENDKQREGQKETETE